MGLEGPEAARQGPWEEDQAEAAPGSGQYVAEPECALRKAATPVITRWSLPYPQTPHLGTKPPFQDAVDTQNSCALRRTESIPASRWRPGCCVTAHGLPLESQLPRSRQAAFLNAKAQLLQTGSFCLYTSAGSFSKEATALDGRQDFPSLSRHLRMKVIQLSS